MRFSPTIFLQSMEVGESADLPKEANYLSIKVIATQYKKGGVGEWTFNADENTRIITVTRIR